MKKFLMFLAFFTIINAYSQDKDSLQKLTVEKFYSDVKEGFSNLVSNLQGPAKHTYEIYVIQHKTVGITKGITSIFSITTFLIILSLSHKKANWDDGILAAIFTVLGFAGFLISLGASIFYLTGDLNKILNPEYYAIQDIIRVFK